MENNTTAQERQEKDKHAVIEALKEMPIVQVVCKRTGISRATYYRWRKEDVAFFRESGRALVEGYEFINDMSESQVITLIKEKKMPAITLWLRSHHPQYGSKARPYEAAMARGELTPEEKKIVADALALTSGKRIQEKRL